ncbi:MAG: hypothetical protein KF712_11750 [Akkermansiaceae bacterium]|nr:hypothetical protein [Akkermansiaceae bacterium]
MKQTLRRLAAAAAGLTAAVLISSCAYDPYYSDGYGGGYSSGSYSTSVFISTGDPRWGYDPYSHSYYDYHRRAYYDPYLYGYYPVGFRPPIVYGVPHPHGWRPGSRYCPPPSRVRSHTLSGYQNRESLYRNSNFSWRNEVRQRDSGSRFQPGSDYGRGRPGGFDRSRTDNDRGDRGGFNRGNVPVQRQFPGGDADRGRGPGRDSSPFVRPPQRDSSNFGRPQREGGFQRREAPDRPQIRPDIRQQAPERPQFRQQAPERPQFRPERSRESNRPTPSGINNPVRLAPDRPAPPQRQAPSFQRESRQQAPSAGDGGRRGDGRGSRRE